jgi:hypothetical protein
MNIRYDKAGNIIMWCDDGNERSDLVSLSQQADSPLDAERMFFTEAGITFYEVEADKDIEFEIVSPESCGALTAATLISDGKNIYGDMEYQVRSFIADLTAGREVFWTKG